MTELTPCPACHRHVRGCDPVCPFCAQALPECSGDARAALPGPRPRLSRAALFAAGATLVGAGACSSTETKSDAATDAAVRIDAQPDIQPDRSNLPDGPIPIYSAVFPPQKSRVAQAPPGGAGGRDEPTAVAVIPPPRRHGRAPARRGR